jgi:hypothetical protein
VSTVPLGGSDDVWLRLLAAPFAAAWYVIGLGLVGFFIFISIFIGLSLFGMVYGCIVGAITAIPILIELARILGRDG